MRFTRNISHISPYRSTVRVLGTKTRTREIVRSVSNRNTRMKSCMLCRNYVTIIHSNLPHVSLYDLPQLRYNFLLKHATCQFVFSTRPVTRLFAFFTATTSQFSIRFNTMPIYLLIKRLCRFQMDSSTWWFTRSTATTTTFSIRLNNTNVCMFCRS